MSMRNTRVGIVGVGYCHSEMAARFAFGYFLLAIFFTT